MTKRKTRQRRVSSIDVAREAGVSQATVSRVFNQKKGVNVSDETVKKIRAAAEMLNYRPSVIARSLQENSTNIIGIINRRFDSAFHMESLDLFSQELQKQGYSTLLLNLPTDRSMDSALYKALEYQVDGIILTSAELSSHLVEECLNYDTPVVQYNRYSIYQDVDSVCLDNYKAGVEVGNHLVETGHRRIGYIGIAESSTSIDRRKGLEQSLERVNLSLYCEHNGVLTHESGCAAADTVFRGVESDKWPDAVFCINDDVAIGFIDQARSVYKVRIPEDVAVVGFDDASISRWPQYNLTTVSQPIRTMVVETIAILLDLIRYEKSGVIKKMIPGTLVKRATVNEKK